MGALKRKIWELIEAEDSGSSSRMRYDWVDLFLMTLISLNVVAVVLETVPELGRSYAAAFRWFETFSVIVFTVEYIIRIAVCTENPLFKGALRGRLRFALTPFAIIDLLAILPSLLPLFFALDLRILRILRIFRFLRVLKLGRYSHSLRVIGRVLAAKRADLAVTIVVVLLLLTLASSAIYVLESDAQPEAFTSIPMSMWWGIATLTTVGYGDVYPITTLGKIFAAIIALLGVGIVALPAGILASGFSEEMNRRGSMSATTVCPVCGHRFTTDNGGVEHAPGHLEP
ncbi:MAG: ion transporter [Bacteroidia bacterium]|nr:ion transporter [Bacteroidia bacterium]